VESIILMIEGKNMTEADRLATAHWSYIESVLEAHGINSGLIDVVMFHYKSAFVHGYKHGKTDGLADNSWIEAKTPIQAPDQPPTS